MIFPYISIYFDIHLKKKGNCRGTNFTTTQLQTDSHLRNWDNISVISDNYCLRTPSTQIQGTHSIHIAWQLNSQQSTVTSICNFYSTLSITLKKRCWSLKQPSKHAEITNKSVIMFMTRCSTSKNFYYDNRSNIFSAFIFFLK